jgi:hypothetical protein
VNLTFYSTDAKHQFWGIVAIGAGVFLAWVVSTYGRSRLNRDQLLLPAAYLRQRIDTYRLPLLHAPPSVERTSMTNTLDAMDRLLSALSESVLDGKGFLNPALPSPFPSNAPKLGDYKAYLQEQDDWAAVLDTVVRDGFTTAWAQLPANANPAAVKAVNDCIKDIDSLLPKGAAKAPALVDVGARINSALQKLDADLKTANQAARFGAPPIGEVVIGDRSYEQINVEIQFISAVVWLVAGLMSMAAGSYVLVFMNLGFGVPTDFLVCLFWGFGLPVAGNQLMQMSSASIGTTLGISVTK